MKTTSLSILICIVCVLPCRAQDTVHSDKFPVSGASYDVTCTDEAQKVTTFYAGRLKVLAVGDNGWCRVEYSAMNYTTSKMDDKKQAWINFVYLSSAVEAIEAK